MCIGIPMQVTSVRAGFALARGREGQRELSTALVGPVAVGDWVLAFLDSARERISAERAAEVDAVLDLLEAALRGTAAAEPGWALPSEVRVDELQHLAGGGGAGSGSSDSPGVAARDVAGDHR